jgi:dTDP-4-dehydrorhamnose 3,5-epimerase
MNIINTNIEGLVIVEPNVFEDERGYFMETYKSSNFNKLLGKIDFVQDNESKSTKGVLRGLHFQNPPYAQSKLVRCIKGEILDIVLDLRKNSITYGKIESTILSEVNKRQLFIPRGFAHGFIVLSDSAIFSYKVDNFYNRNSDNGVLWYDKDLNIDWKINKSDIIVSKKDSKLLPFRSINSPF